jgi:hypothetical protein
VVNHLNTVRGKGMASMYSWSCKWYSARNVLSLSLVPYSCCWVLIIPMECGCFDFRSYKNGFVWHDLADDDPVLPAADGEYILKGSELVDQSSPAPGIPKFSSSSEFPFAFLYLYEKYSVLSC